MNHVALISLKRIWRREKELKMTEARDFYIFEEDLEGRERTEDK